MEGREAGKKRKVPSSGPLWRMESFRWSDLFGVGVGNVRSSKRRSFFFENLVVLV